jgi:RNA polymerase sigma-70 factor, ECF subfamily
VAQSDETLVRRYLEGDRQAFRTLVERHTPAVFNLAARMTGDREDAADIAQEAFRRVFEALPGSRTELPFKPWLLQIAVNLCRDWAKRRRAVPFASLVSAVEVDDDENAAENLPDLTPLPGELLEASETRETLRRAIEELPASYRAAIVLRYDEDLSYQEISTALGLPLNTVRTHLARAKKLLHARLQTEEG